MRATIAQAESNQREAERANQLAEARKLMTQPVTVDVPIKGPELIPGTTGKVIFHLDKLILKIVIKQVITPT
jgi:hypothetical protein